MYHSHATTQMAEQENPSECTQRKYPFHFNAFHTARRYQKTKPCLFCRASNSEDSIEHILKCPSIGSCFATVWKARNSPIPATYWFLLEGDGKTRLCMACFVFAVYTVHNRVRHTNNITDLRQQIYMSLNLPSLPKPLRRAWEDLFNYSTS